MSNKGSILDIPIILMMLFGSAIAIIVAAKIYDAFTDQYTPNTATAQTIIDKGTTATRRFNAGFLIYTVGLGIAAVVGAFVIRTHPIFFPISLIMLAIFMMVIPQVSNAFETFIQNNIVSSLGNEFGTIVKIMRNLPIIMLGIGFLVMLALYAKPQMGSV